MPHTLDKSFSPHRPATAARRSLAQSLYWLAAIGLATVLLYFSIRGIQWSRVWQSLADARFSYVATCCCLITVNLFLRASRWRILLSAAGPVHLQAAFWATAAGYFGNSFLPARAGELVRSVMVSTRTGLSKTYVLTTALSERMADAIALIIISACVLLVLPAKPGWLADGAKPLAALAFGGVLAIVLLPRLESLLQRVFSRAPISHRGRLILGRLLEQVLLGVRSFHDLRRFCLFAGFTMIIWLIDSITARMCAHALGLTISFPVVLLLLAALGLGSALPSTPGYVGVYQFVAVSVLTPFGFRRDDSIAYMLLFQASLYAVISFWGLLALWQARRTGADSRPGAYFGDLRVPADQ